jgi:hypothetical protein
MPIRFGKMVKIDHRWRSLNFESAETVADYFRPRDRHVRAPANSGRPIADAQAADADASAPAPRRHRGQQYAAEDGGLRRLGTIGPSTTASESQRRWSRAVDEQCNAVTKLDSRPLPQWVRLVLGDPKPTAHR